MPQSDFVLEFNSIQFKLSNTMKFVGFGLSVIDISIEKWNEERE